MLLLVSQMRMQKDPTFLLFLRNFLVLTPPRWLLQRLAKRVPIPVLTLLLFRMIADAPATSFHVMKRVFALPIFFLFLVMGTQFRQQRKQRQDMIESFLVLRRIVQTR
mmetsp:Transcript_31144/g.61406  ORF Transcript_31144/g.61406 Transcript_31144/m.61406 type:complete len:108 (-) Transcript_31144:2262-2585(-)